MFSFKYISGGIGRGVVGDPSWHDVGARNALISRGLRSKEIALKRHLSLVGYCFMYMPILDFMTLLST